MDTQIIIKQLEEIYNLELNIKVRGFYSRNPLFAQMKFNKFKEYISKYKFTDEFKLLDIQDYSSFDNYDTSFDFFIYIKDKNDMCVFQFYHSIILPIGKIESYLKDKSKENEGYTLPYDGNTKFNNYIKKFDQSLTFLSEDMGSIETPNITTDLGDSMKEKNLWYALFYGG